MILKLRNFFALKAAARIVAAPVIVGLGFVCVLQINAHYKQGYGVSYDFWAFVAMVFCLGWAYGWSRTHTAVGVLSEK